MFNIFGTRIDVHKGSPLEVKAEGLVIPANDHLWMGTGIGGTIKKEGGAEIEVEAVRQGPAQLGQAIPTGGGSLSFRRIYHAVLAGQDLKIDHGQIRPALTAAMQAAAQDGVTRLAVAPLENEEMIGAFHDASREVVGVLVGELAKETCVREVILTVTVEEGRRAYRQAFHNALSQNA